MRAQETLRAFSRELTLTCVKPKKATVVDLDVVSILRCPKSHTKLTWAGEGLLRSEAGHLYEVDDGIFLLLEPVNANDVEKRHLRKEKAETQAYYDSFGWASTGGKAFEEVKRFVDTRPVAWSYTAKCIARVRKHIPRSGRFILDVASGPIPYREYMAFHEHFSYRICVDLSLEALRIAKKKLGDRGIYILGDLTQLPIADAAIDAAISFHTIYHIPADEQGRAFEEIHRVLRQDGQAAVIYTWGYSPLTARLLRALDALNIPTASGDAPSGLYYHPHEKEWFLSRNWPFEYDIRAWRTMPAVALQRLGSGVIERALYATLFQLENLFPKFFGLHGQYPLIVIRGEKSTQRS